MNAPRQPAPAPNDHKSRGGVARPWHALRYSRQGLIEAFRQRGGAAEPDRGGPDALVVPVA